MRSAGIVMRIAAAGLAAWMASGCGQRMASGGDATETGNARVTGQVVMEGGLPGVGAEVTILPSDFNPVRGGAVPDSLKDTTDGQGRYRFARIKPGTWNLLVRHAGTRTRSALFGLELAAGAVGVPDDTLHKTGSMSVPLPETQDSGVGYVFVPGTTYKKRVDSELRIVGSVILDSLPPGLVPSVVYTKGDSASPVIILATDVPVHAGDTAHVDAYATWAHSARLALNTSASGVAIAKDQRNFPLLVRLAAPEFDFSAAAEGGADLRFSKPDGTPLPLQIASWDAKSGKAEVWVRMDTVRANSASQYITLHWGKQDAAAPKDVGSLARKPVFDTAAGFAGAWHLEEDAAGITANGLYKDATGSGNDGDDRVSNASRAGVVGAGHGLDSGDYMVASKQVAGLRSPKSFTLSIWYRGACKGCGPVGGELISVGDNFGIRLRPGIDLHFWYWPAKMPAGSTSDWYEVNAKIPEAADANWHQVVGTFDGAVLRLYVDGTEAAKADAPDAVGYLFPINVTLGKHGNGKPGYEYQGDLDEAQVHSAVRDADWIRLGFENQKTGSKFPAMTSQ
jgi:hypothetical protein